MNSLKTATMRFANLASTANGALGKRDFARSLWHMTKKPAATGASGDHVTVLNVHKPSINCTCGCNVHTKGESPIENNVCRKLKDWRMFLHGYITSKAGC